MLTRSNVITVSGNAIAGSGDPEYLPADADPLVALMEASQQLTTLMSDLAEARRSDPTDDVTSALVHSNIDGESLSPAEVASFFILLVIAGNDTTRNAISNGLLALAEHPDQRALWQADPAGIAADGRGRDRAVGLSHHLDAPHGRRTRRAGRRGTGPR